MSDTTNDKHTAGPWEVHVNPSSPYQPIVRRGDEGGFLVKGRTEERELADARLIAASPDLLAALKLTVDYGMPPNIKAQVRAAIAKATGSVMKRHHTLLSCGCGADCSQLSEDCRGYTIGTRFDFEEGGLCVEHLCMEHIARRDNAVIAAQKAKKKAALCAERRAE